MPCLRCGSLRQWEQDQRFCSASCKGLYYGKAEAAGRQPATLDDVIFDTLVADYPRALEEWGKRTERDVSQYQQPSRAEVYADSIMNTSFGAGHGVGLRAAHSDYGSEYPPVQRTPLQERLRTR